MDRLLIALQSKDIIGFTISGFLRDCLLTPHRVQRYNAPLKEHLASLLMTMNLLAFAFHTVCDPVAKRWHEAREAFGARRRFFEDPRSITGYHLFTDWDALIRTMITGELPPEPKVR